MRRMKWLLGLLLLAGIAITWWTYHATIRLEPLDPKRFARMNDTQQAEWLVKQILARSKRKDWLARLPDQLPFLRQSERGTLRFRELELIGIACDEYALPHLINRTAPYLTDGRTQHTHAEVDHLLIHQALQQARKGNWQGAEQTIQRIQQTEMQALALAHLGCLQAHLGDTASAQQSFERAYTLLRQSATFAWFVKYVLKLILQHAPETQREAWLERLSAEAQRSFKIVETEILLEAYRALGDTERLREMLEKVRASRAFRSVRARIGEQLILALIEQGQADEGLRALVQRGTISDTLAVQVARALYQQGHHADARRFADAIRDRFIERGFPDVRFRPKTHFGTVQVATRHGQVKVRIASPYGSSAALMETYIAWGQPQEAERVLNAYEPKGQAYRRVLLASVYHAHGHTARAQQHLEQALQMIQERRQRASSADIFEIHSLQLTRMYVARALATIGDAARALEVAQSLPQEYQKKVLHEILAQRLQEKSRMQPRLRVYREVFE